MGRPLAVLVFVLISFSAAADVEIAEPKFIPGKVTALAGDDSRFYVIGGSMLTRLERDGTIVDPDGLYLDGLVNGSGSAALGAGILVGTFNLENFGQLAGASVDGEVLWTIESPKRLYYGAAFDGSAFVVLWRQANANPNTHTYDYGFARFDAAGHELESKMLLEDTASFPAMTQARFGDGVLVAWVDAGVVSATYVRSGKPFLVPRAIGATTTAAPAIAIASNGSQSLVVWKASPAGRLDAVMVGPSLRVMHGPLTVAESSGGQHAAAWDGAAYRLAWRSSAGAVESADFDTALGFLRRATLFSDAPPFASIRVVAGAGGVLFVRDADGFFVAAGEPVTEPVPRPLRTARARYSYPHLTWTGDRYAAAWVDDANRLRARFFARDGSPLGASFSISAERRTLVGVVASADTLLVLTSGQDGLGAQRFDFAGEPIDAAPFAIAGGYVTAASDGRDFTIAAAQGCTVRLHMLGARAPFLPASAVELRLCDMSATPRLEGIFDLLLAWDGSEYGLVYHLTYRGQCYCTPVAETQPMMLRFSPSGAATPSIALKDRELATGLAAAHGRYYVGWYRGGLLVPYALAGATELPKGTSHASYGVVWTGTSFIVLYAIGYEVRDGNGAILSDNLHIANGTAVAGDGQGGAMIVYVDYPRGRLLGKLIRTPAPRHRAARK